MTLAGFVIALGIVVDDAILDVENIMRRLRLARRAGDPRSTARIILDASLEVRRADRLRDPHRGHRRRARPVHAGPDRIVLQAADCSLCARDRGLARRGDDGDAGALPDPAAERATRRARITVSSSGCCATTRPCWNGSPERRVLAYITVGVVTLAGIGVWPLLGHSLLPSFKERDFLMHWVTSPDTSLPEMLRITTRASKELRAIPGVRNFGAHIGQAFAADEVVGVNFGENWISISRDADYDKTHARIEEMVEGYPGLYRDVQTYLKERIREVLTGAGEAIVVRIFGLDLDVPRGTRRRRSARHSRTFRTSSTCTRS